MSYRTINPIRTFDGESHPMLRRQFHWRDEGQASTALFAGKEMFVCVNDDGKTYQLTYLDMAHPDKFNSINDAKSAAQPFAIAVLVYMLKCVGIPDTERNDPLLKNL